MMINPADFSLGSSASPPPPSQGSNLFVEFSVLVPKNWADLLVEMSISKDTSVSHVLREMINQGLRRSENGDPGIQRS